MPAFPQSSDAAQALAGVDHAQVAAAALPAFKTDGLRVCAGAIVIVMGGGHVELYARE